MEEVKLPPFKRRPVLIKSSKDWTHDLYQVKRMHDLGYTGKDVKVTVIDTGVNFNHKDFRKSMDEGRLTVMSTIQGVKGQDGNGHGSWCASRYIGDQLGMIPDCELISIKALSDGGGGDIDDVIQAFHIGLDLKSDIISASIGWPCGHYENEFKEITKRAIDQGTMLFAAAGNDGTYNDVDAPGCYEGVVSVSAFNSLFRRSSFADWSDDITLYAPGNGKGAYLGQSVADLSGTSMATPIAGAAYGMILPYLRENNECINYKTIKRLTTCL